MTTTPPRNVCLVGDAAEQLATLPAGIVQTCATSPPYWGLRDYGEAGQLGLEATPDEYVARMVEVFREVRRVLRDDGTLWLNLGDSYAGAGYGKGTGHAGIGGGDFKQKPKTALPPGLKPKDLCGIPWRVAFALQADGWWLRSDIVWHKPNPMPEAVTDRPTGAHEYVFLLSKSARYYYDADAIKERALQPPGEPARSGQDTAKAIGRRSQDGVANNNGAGKSILGSNQGSSTRNRRSVWTVATRPYAAAHFAVWPPALVTPMIQAGSKPGDLVLDPFMGSGTTAQVAQDLGRDWLGVELNPDYLSLQAKRTAQLSLLGLA